MSKALDRLSKLIAKADGAATEHERIAYMEAAEKLSALIGVELAVARSHHASKQRQEPVKDFKVKVNDFSAKPIHRSAMMDLFLGIADAHDVRVVISGGSYLAFCYGYEEDIKLVEALYGALSIQMVREADAALKRGDQRYVIDYATKTIGINGKVFRRNFYEGFIRRVSGRLLEAKKSAIRETDEVSGGGTELVLRDKTQFVDKFFEESIEHMSLRGYSGLNNTDNYHRDAISQGSSAANRANIGLSNSDVGAANRASLPQG